MCIIISEGPLHTKQYDTSWYPSLKYLDVKIWDKIPDETQMYMYVHGHSFRFMFVWWMQNSSRQQSNNQAVLITDSGMTLQWAGSDESHETRVLPINVSSHIIVKSWSITVLQTRTLLRHVSHDSVVGGNSRCVNYLMSSSTSCIMNWHAAVCRCKNSLGLYPREMCFCPLILIFEVCEIIFKVHVYFVLCEKWGKAAIECITSRTIFTFF